MCLQDDTTPFSIACYQGHFEVVKLLIDSGVDKEKADNVGESSSLEHIISYDIL